MTRTLIPLRDGAVIDEPDDVVRTDVAIIGSGMGGGTLAYALRSSGRKVLIVERGGFLEREPENSQPEAVFVQGRYKTASPWIDGRTGKTFQPGVYYWVGGNTKMYGACLPRFRASDFEETTHADGTSPRWPFSYDDLEPFYGQAERLYGVRGRTGEDPTEPPRSTDFPAVALEHEPTIERFAERLAAQGLHPFHMPNGMDLNSIEDRRRATTSDGSPSEDGTKNDAENCAVRPALTSKDVSMLTRCTVRKLLTSPDGSRLVAAEASSGGRTIRIEANTFVLAAGAIDSATVLLRSTSPEHPAGLGNSSGLVGRNYMAHRATFLIGIDPRRRNLTAWQKTLGLNDWYAPSETTPVPLGSVQMLGKLQGAMVKSSRPWAPTPVLDLVTQRSIDLFLLTEDLPLPDNRVELRGEDTVVSWKPNNAEAHAELTRRVRTAVRRAGYPVVLTEQMGIGNNSHMCGTAVAGHDPDTSVLDASCRSHDVKNLWIVDGSFFPSSAALNPALTIAANALRVSHTIAAATD